VTLPLCARWIVAFLNKASAAKKFPRGTTLTLAHPPDDIASVVGDEGAAFLVNDDVDRPAMRMAVSRQKAAQEIDGRA